MNVVDFCRSKYGTGINQSRLYRKLRRFVREHALGDLYEESEDFTDYGFCVEEDDLEQLRYDIYEPDLFRELAVRLASASHEPKLSQVEYAIVIQALKDFRNAYNVQGDDLLLVDRETGRLAKGQHDEYFSGLTRVIQKLDPQYHENGS